MAEAFIKVSLEWLRNLLTKLSGEKYIYRWKLLDVIAVWLCVVSSLFGRNALGLTQWILLTHICVGEQGQHWFRLGASSTPSQYSKQCRFISNNIQWSANQNTNIVPKKKMPFNINHVAQVWNVYGILLNRWKIKSPRTAITNCSLAYTG